MSKADKNSAWNWVQHDTCFVGSSPSLKHSAKLASFDMDDTIITRKSGAKFPINADDWIFLNDKVVPCLKKLAADGFKIVIFTNQMGVTTGKSKIEDIKKKVANIAAAMDIEMQVLAATGEDEYRKPGLGMWTLFNQKFNGNIKVDMKVSFYCGDAAGRKDGKHKDFSDSDLKFGLNVGLPFKTPENLFFGEKDKIEVKGFNPSTVPETGELIVGKGDKVAFVEKEMVLMVGAPGSGKSTFCVNYLPKYVRVNRDTLKTKEKCYKVADEALSQGKSVVIDNTNPKKEDRRYFIDLAKKHGVKVRCFEVLTPKDICFHNDYQRIANDKRKHLSGKAGSIPIHTFFKYKEEPSTAEGFYEVNKVNFIAKFESPADKEFYHLFSKK